MFNVIDVEVIGSQMRTMLNVVEIQLWEDMQKKLLGKKTTSVRRGEVGHQL